MGKSKSNGSRKAGVRAKYIQYTEKMNRWLLECDHLAKHEDLRVQFCKKFKVNISLPAFTSKMYRVNEDWAKAPISVIPIGESMKDKVDIVPVTDPIDTMTLTQVNGLLDEMRVKIDEIRSFMR